MRSEGHSCLGPFAIDTKDKSFPVYAPLLFASLDRLLCVDFGLVPGFFGQLGEERGKPVGANSYSFSVYLTLLMAGYIWTMLWKHHYPALTVPGDDGITDDLLRALGGGGQYTQCLSPKLPAAIPPFPIGF